MTSTKRSDKKGVEAQQCKSQGFWLTAIQIARKICRLMRYIAASLTNQIADIFALMIMLSIRKPIWRRSLGNFESSK